MTVTAGTVPYPRRIDRLRVSLLPRSIATTPSRLRAVSVLLLVAVAGSAIAGAVALKTRYDAARDVEVGAAPLLEDAEQLYVDLAHADATASRAFLAGNREDRRTFESYERDIASANARLAAIGNEAGHQASARDAIDVISRGVPRYATLVAAARANNLQGFPVGAAYLRQASAELRTEVLPAATTVVRQASARLQGDYRTGTSPPAAIIAAFMLAALLIGLVAAQVFLFRRTNRMLNLGLLVATIVIALTAGAASLQLFDAQRSLARAGREGSDPVQVLVGARILGLRAQSASTSSVIERDPSAEVGFLADEITGSNGLLSALGQTSLPSGSQTAAKQLAVDFLQYRRVLAAVQTALDPLDFRTAERLALTDQPEKADVVDARLQGEITKAQARLEVAAADAQRWFAVAIVSLTLASLAAAALIAFGMQRRISEYR